MKKRNTVRCPYCGAQAKLRPATAVYGNATIDKSAFVYLCDRYPTCDAYVNAHPHSKEPMGTLANGDLRNKRIQAHRAFDEIMKRRHMTRKEGSIPFYRISAWYSDRRSTYCQVRRIYV